MKLKSLQQVYALIGNKLEELRKMKGYQTIKDFTMAFKLPSIHYWRIENGKTNPTLASLYKILKIHKMSILDFFSQLAEKENTVKRVHER